MSDPAPQEWSFESNYNEQGVDMTLIAHMLSLSPLERLQLMERHARDIKWLHENARLIPGAKLDSPAANRNSGQDLPVSE